MFGTLLKNYISIYLYTCGFTQFGKCSPFKPEIKFSAAIQDILVRVVLLALPRCGMMVMLSSVSKGWSAGSEWLRLGHIQTGGKDAFVLQGIIERI